MRDNPFRGIGKSSVDPDIIQTIPSVFTGIAAGPEFEAECEELDRYRRKGEPFNYQILRLRRAAEQLKGL